MMANSGARGSFKQIRQLAGMRGLMANPKGEIIERPIKSNFMEGLSVLEYFISTHGARKGLADTALRTADSGYLTRRLVDVAQDVIIREVDCGTDEYIEMAVWNEGGEPNENLVGRTAAQPITTKRGRMLAEGGEEIGRQQLADIVEAFADDHEKGVRVTVPVRSVLKCKAPSGVCQACYARAMATGQTAQIGDAVGIVAAQSIGEPGTQLTMRTFHTGGVAGADITHGLPRVVELFEARKPKGLAKIAEQDGDRLDRRDREGSDGGHHRRGRRGAPPRLPAAHAPVCERAARRSQAGKQLNEGSLYPHELLAIRGRTETEQYLVKEVQEVYKSQGVDINDKHIELIVRQMLKKVQGRPEGRHRLPARAVRGPLRIRDRQRRRDRQGWRDRPVSRTSSWASPRPRSNTDSFLSAASFQETTKVLTDASLEGKIDRLNGLKENVIIGKLIPAATGLKRYRRIEIEPSEPLPRAIDDVGLLDQEEIAAELGLADGEALSAGYGSEFDADLASLEKIGAGSSDPGFVEGLGELEVPEESGSRARSGEVFSESVDSGACAAVRDMSVPRGRMRARSFMRLTAASRPALQVSASRSVSPLAGASARARSPHASAHSWQASLKASSIQASGLSRRIGFDRVELPVGVGAPHRAVEAQVGQRRQAQQVGEVFVGLLLPAAGPGKLEIGLEREQVLGRAGRKKVGYAVDRMERPLRAGRAWWSTGEQRDHAVDVHEQQGSDLRRLARLADRLGLPVSLLSLACTEVITGNLPESRQRSKASVVRCRWITPSGPQP